MELSQALTNNVGGGHEVQISAPLYVEMDITTKCQLKCSYCSAAPLSGDELPAKHALRLLREIAALRVYSVSLSGGEPTLHSEFLTILEYAARNIPVVMLSTNGLRLANHEFAEKVHQIAPSSLIAISLDSVGL